MTLQLYNVPCSREARDKACNPRVFLFPQRIPFLFAGHEFASPNVEINAAMWILLIQDDRLLISRSNF